MEHLLATLQTIGKIVINHILVLHRMISIFAIVKEHFVVCVRCQLLCVFAGQFVDILVVVDMATVGWVCVTVMSHGQETRVND